MHPQNLIFIDPKIFVYWVKYHVRVSNDPYTPVYILLDRGITLVLYPRIEIQTIDEQF